MNMTRVGPFEPVLNVASMILEKLIQHEIKKCEHVHVPRRMNA